MGSALRVLLIVVAVLAGAVPAHGSVSSAPAGVPGATFVPARSVLASAAPALAAAQPSCPAGLVALTFDDGPARGVTRALVQTLQDHHVPATFFMVGSRVSTAPGVARMVARAGFTIGNHTWSHPELTRLPDRSVRREIRSTARELRRTGIRTSTLMRPPYGAIDARVRADVRGLGLVPVLWNVDSEDWRGGSARQIADSILGQLRRHRDNVVLQHDGIRNSPASIAAVPRVIRQARRQGYCFGRLGSRGHVLPPLRSNPSTVANRVAAAARLVPGAAVVETPFGRVLDRVHAAPA